jgi:hypothetical protein
MEGLDLPKRRETSRELDQPLERGLDDQEWGMVQLAQNIVSEELQALGIDSAKVKRIFPYPVQRDQVRVFEEGHPKFPRVGAHADFVNRELALSENGITISNQWEDIYVGPAKKIMKFYLLLHEIIHAAGFSTEAPQGGPRRVGYMQYGPRAENGTGDIMRYFNEGVVQHLTKQWADRHRDAIIDLLGVEDSDFDFAEEPESTIYRQSRRVLDLIVEGISTAKDEDQNQIYERIARGHFTGEMMHLRDIERTFGAGRLREIAMIGAEEEPTVS